MAISKDAVHAVKNKDDVFLIARWLERNYSVRESDMWLFGCNVALRISDLLSLKYEDMQGGHIRITEGKTGKYRQIKLNERALNIYRKRRQDNPTDIYLFQAKSRNVKYPKPITRQYASQAIKAAGDGYGLRLGTHSMRKTLGYMMHTGGAAIERICQVLNHTSPTVTMRYIGLVQEDIDNAYVEFVI